jgi:hypothetical protein
MRGKVVCFVSFFFLHVFKMATKNCMVHNAYVWFLVSFLQIVLVRVISIDSQILITPSDLQESDQHRPYQMLMHHKSKYIAFFMYICVIWVFWLISYLPTFCNIWTRQNQSAYDKIYDVVDLIWENNIRYANKYQGHSFQTHVIKNDALNATYVHDFMSNVIIL